MKHFKHLITLLFALHGLLAFSPACSQAVDPLDTLKTPWFNMQVNYLQFNNRAALSHLYQSWAQTSSKKLVLVTLGDSHLQAGIYPGQLRRQLQALKGDGGRGLVFSYSAAKSWAGSDYVTSHTGTWQYAKSLIVPARLPLGVVGMSCKTYDASATLTFRFTGDSLLNNTRLKLFISKQPHSFDLNVQAGGSTIPVIIDSFLADTVPYILVNLPEASRTIVLRTAKHNSAQSNFEFYGMVLETPADTGLIMHNAGVSGASYRSVLYEDLFVPQLASLRPDAVVIDFGTNDYHYENRVRPELDSQVIQVINKVRTAAPGASIILTTTMDMYRKGIDVEAGPVFCDMIRRIAREQKCALWDWYWISGGKTSMRTFVDSGLAQHDMVHLTTLGYRLKGKLLYEAVANTMQWMQNNPVANSLIIDVDSLIAREAADSTLDTIKTVASKYYPTGGKYTGKHRVHTVRNGESLYIIARKYGISVEALKKANRLSGSMIRPGQKLVIPGKG